MKGMLKIENDKVRGSNLQLNVVETLVLYRTLKDFSENSENHSADIKVALKMLDDMKESLFVDGAQS